MSNYPDRRQEAHDLAKAAIRADIKSHTCWHVYGLLHRNDRDYEQAAKCYRQAMRIDPTNLGISRDLCYIEMQLRDISSLISTAEKVLSTKSNMRNHWMMLAVAHHLAGNHRVSVAVRCTINLQKWSTATPFLLHRKYFTAVTTSSSVELLCSRDQKGTELMFCAVV